MNIRFAALGWALVLPVLLSVADVASAQQAQSSQDTAQTWRGRGMGRGAGMGLRRGHFMRGGHVGPMMIIGVKDELGLSEQQVARLEKIREDHHALMQAQMKQLADHREAMRQARENDDWDALQKGIDDGAKLQAGIARGLLNVERQSLEVLSAEQRNKFETWQEGLRVFGRQRMLHRQEMRGRGMRGMRMQRHRQPAPPPPPQS
ncbi:MAG: Spy/CpxP family protein refolding chaperone [Gemmatimonadales bacterium]|jgi:Spy/CpxP family protein refolding chaperone